MDGVFRSNLFESDTMKRIFLGTGACLFSLSMTIMGLSSCGSGHDTPQFSTGSLALNAATPSSKTASENPIAKADGPEKEAYKPLTGSNTRMASATDIIARKQVPILCYHQIRNWKPTDSKVAKDYIVPEEQFRAQMKSLHDSGYQTILPDQLFDYLAYGAAIPEKSVILTFDDNDLDQYTVAYPEMKKYGFKGVFFIMTVSMNKPRYMSREQIRELSDAGHVIGSHTWDHKNVKKYEAGDWPVQIEKPSRQLEEITGKKIEYFAYPFGLWKPEVIPGLKQRGMKAAFQLADKRDPQDPLHSVRRIIVPGQWSVSTMHRAMRNSFQ
jgi:peptidoglycan/xylan/chitin deacetylase (PgdA/CDA1 family)